MWPGLHERLMHAKSAMSILGGGHGHTGRDIGTRSRHWGNHDELGGEPWGSPSYHENESAHL